MQRKLLEATAILALSATIYWLVQSPGYESILAFLGSLVALLALEFKSSEDSLAMSVVERIRRLATRRIAEATYLNYRDRDPRLLNDPLMISGLEHRYNCVAFRLAETPVPAVVIWENRCELVLPDSVLGDLDGAHPATLYESPIFNPVEYEKARAFIKEQYEQGPVKYEGVDYCMTRIDVSKAIPKIHGKLGRYYDNILSQYAIEWELKKAVLADPLRRVDRALSEGNLPLREAAESGRNPILDGGGRCAAITVSTLTMFRRRGKYWCLIARRSGEVGVSPGLLHVAPAGMFEAPSIDETWSVENNIWRELLEEVYDEKEEHGIGRPRSLAGLLSKEPVRTLRKLISEGKAELSVTGICCDLLNLRTEICTVLFVPDESFAEAREPRLNWEYESQGPTGRFAVPWDAVDDLVEREARERGFVASGATCLGLGRRWIADRHKR
ncbi:MAG: hypothetical protein ABI665_01625 [Vicinamibacterales bacterium]